MKRLAIPILFLLIPNIYGQQSAPVNSDIASVTVYLHGAQVTRESAVTLKAGSQQILFSNLPQQIDQQSIQVSGEGNFIIQSVNFQVNYLKSPQKSTEIMALEDSLEQLQHRVKVNNITIGAAQEEENMLKANEKLGGTQTGIKAADISAAADMLGSRLMDINMRILKHQEINQKLNEKIQKIANQLNNLKNKANAPVGEILVSVSAPQAVKGHITFSYVVMNAGWVPFYDIRAIDVNSKIDLGYKGKISQSTGEDWNQVKLTLSTGNPLISGVQPDLQPWFLSFLPDQPVPRFKSMPAAANAPQLKREELNENVVVGYGTVKTSADYTIQQNNQTTTTFSISLPYSIPSDGQQYTVGIGNHSLDARYEYFCVPKLDRDAFLVAHIAGWEDLNLMPGEVNIYFEGKFTGTSYLNTSNANDTLDISLGRDQAIIVSRTRMKDFSANQFIGNQKKESRSFEIAVRNTKKQTVQITLEDQVPVSTNKEIDVEKQEISGGNLDAQTGKISWSFTLAPAQDKKIKLGYTVKYPENKKIVLE